MQARPNLSLQMSIPRDQAMRARVRDQILPDDIQSGPDAHRHDQLGSVSTFPQL